MRLNLVTAPTEEPVILADARRQCKVETTDEDALINALIPAARERAEAITGRQFLRAEYQGLLDGAPCELVLELPKPPLLSIDSVTYLDTAGALQTWGPSSYQVDKPAGPFAPLGRLAPMPTAAWPIAGSGYLNCFTVNFKAGYGTTADAVPRPIRLAILLMIGFWYVNREDLGGSDVRGIYGNAPAPMHALALLTPYKVHR